MPSLRTIRIHDDTDTDADAPTPAAAADPFKGRRGRRGPKRYSYTIVDVAHAAGVSVRAVRQAASKERHELVMADIVSVARFIVRRLPGAPRRRGRKPRGKVTQ